MSELAIRLIRENKRTQNPFLDLGNCGLKNSLPKGLDKCIWLEELNLGTSYQGMPSMNKKNNNIFEGEELVILQNLPNLKSLYLRSTKVQNISFLNNLSQLHILDIRSTNIQDYTLLSNLNLLQSLDLRYNKLQDISFLSSLLQLKELDLSNNQIQDISVLDSMNILESLDLSNNQINDIASLNNLHQLKRLALASNKLHDISFLNNINQLQSLDISNNQIQDISYISNINQLQELYLSNNQIQDISSITNFSQLYVLNVSNNQIKDISFIKNISQLQELYLSNNQIQDISSILNLTQLRILDFSNNQIQDINALKNLNQLIKLNLSTNKLQNINSLENLILLQSLSLSSNQVKNITYLSNLNQLQRLDLNNNQIENIYPLIPLLKKGLKIELFRLLENRINLNKNNISTPPISIIEQGNEAIIQFFDALNKQGKDYIYEAKLTLVGDGGAGKTSLQKRMLNKDSSLPQQEERTRGIEIAQWNFQYQQDKKFTVHIWDFGGQDVYFPVHRFFLTENSVFALLGSTRTHIHNFEYWIPTIYQFGGKSPIILVQNCFDGNTATWNELSNFFANTEFNLIKPFYPVNLPAHNQGLKALESVIQHQIADLPHIGEAVPKSWLKVRETLAELAISIPYVSYERFEQICKETDPENFQGEKVIGILARFFHDLGIMLWYHNKPHLQEWVILQPEWLMNAVYKIIDDIPIQEQKGVIHEQDFQRLWSDSSYETKHHLLKQLLGIFKIAFPKKSKPSDFLLPARLDAISKKEHWGNTENNISLEYHFNFMPRGIVNQMSADLSRLIKKDEEVWNDAVILKQENSFAQIFEDIFNRKIYIKARGKDARGLIILITQSIDNILEDYKGVKPIKQVPCDCSICKTSSRPTQFKYDSLLEWSKESDDVFCNESRSKRSISQLLYNIGKQSFISEYHETASPVIFFSYAWKDETEKLEGSREELVYKLYKSLESDGYIVKRDKEEIGYKSSISNFAQQIGKSSMIIVAISDKYLKSTYCMYELYEIYRNSQLESDKFITKIAPIMVEKLELNNDVIMDGYFDYWKNLETQKKNLLDKIGPRIGEKQIAEHKKIKLIIDNLGDILYLLQDTNSLSKEYLSANNFEQIKKAIKTRFDNK